MLRCSAATPVPPLSVGDMCYTAESKASVSVSPVSKADAWEGDMLVLLAFQQEDKQAFAVLAGDGAAAADKGLEGAAADMISWQEFKVCERGEGGGRGGMLRLSCLVSTGSYNSSQHLLHNDATWGVVTNSLWGEVSSQHVPKLVQ